MRRWILRGGVVGLVSLLMLGGGELVLRAAKGWNLLPGATPAPTAYDREIGWVLVGPHEQAHASEDFDVRVRLDRAGRRVPTRPGPVNEWKGVIVFAGDSTTFGWGVEAEAAFPEVVGAALQHRVINLGVPGYGVDQSVILLERHGLSENPRWVVLMLARNDLTETRAAVSYGRTKVHSRLVGGDLEISPAEVRALGWLERSALFTGVRSRWFTSLAPPAAPGDLDLVGAWVARARRACQRRNAELALVEWDVLSTELAERWSGEGIPVVRAGPLLQELQESGTRPIFSRDPHWIAAAHAIVGRAVAERLSGAGRRSTQ